MEIETPIVQATGCFHHEIIKACAKVAKDVMHDAKDFDASNAVLATNTFFGELLVLLFLLGGEFLPFRFLHGLIGCHAFRFVALKPSIFPDLAAVWKGDGLLLRQFLVMLFAFTRIAQYFYFWLLIEFKEVDGF